MKKCVALATTFVIASLSAAFAQNEPAPLAGQPFAPEAHAASDIPPQSNAPSVDMRRFCARFRYARRIYPEHAMERGQTGDAVVDCTFAADAVIQTCQVISETPANFEFGDAALKLACRATPRQAQANDSQVYTLPGSDLRHIRWTMRFTLG